MQFKTYHSYYRESLKEFGSTQDYQDVVMGLLPQSHIYGLVVTCHATTYRGERVIVLPKFELKTFLEAIQKYKISALFIVCPTRLKICLPHSSSRGLDRIDSII